MARVPVVQVGNVLIAAIQEDLLDREAIDLQERLMMTLERTGAHGVLLDLTLVETVDSFLGRLLHEIVGGTRLMGASTVVVGIQPPVAITLVELGLELNGVRTALNVEKGMTLLGRLALGEQRVRRLHGH